MKKNKKKKVAPYKNIQDQLKDLPSIQGKTITGCLIDHHNVGSSIEARKINCSRCYNVEVTEKDNYCKICGLDLRKTDLEVKIQSQQIKLNLEITKAYTNNLINEYNNKWGIKGST